MENPSAFFSRKLENGQIRLTLRFDESGAMEVKSVDGPDVNRDRMGNLMTNYQFYDPLELRLSGIIVTAAWSFRDQGRYLRLSV